QEVVVVSLGNAQGLTPGRAAIHLGGGIVGRRNRQAARQPDSPISYNENSPKCQYPQANIPSKTWMNALRHACRQPPIRPVHLVRPFLGGDQDFVEIPCSIHPPPNTKSSW